MLVDIKMSYMENKKYSDALCTIRWNRGVLMSQNPSQFMKRFLHEGIGQHLILFFISCCFAVVTLLLHFNILQRLDHAIPKRAVIGWTETRKWNHLQDKTWWCVYYLPDEKSPNFDICFWDVRVFLLGYGGGVGCILCALCQPKINNLLINDSVQAFLYMD